MKLPVTALALCLLVPSAFADSSAPPANFMEAKKQMVKIFSKLNKPTTLYCGCRIVFTKHGYKPDLESCGYRIEEDNERGSRIEAEHIVPVWEFAHSMRCWTQAPKGSGRDNCENTDDRFNRIEADLHNLYPAVGEVNKRRSSYAFVDKLPDRDNPQGFGLCKMFFNKSNYLAEPTERARGIIARAYLYMYARYGLQLDVEHLRLYREWNQKYKPNDDECKRNYMIQKIQGNDNPFVTDKCKLRIRHPHAEKNKVSE